MPALERLPSNTFRTGGSRIRHHGTTFITPDGGGLAVVGARVEVTAVFRWVESWSQLTPEESSTRIIGPDPDPIFSGDTIFTTDTITHSLVAVYVSQVSGLKEVERIF